MGKRRNSSLSESSNESDLSDDKDARLLKKAKLYIAESKSKSKKDKKDKSSKKDKKRDKKDKKRKKEKKSKHEKERKHSSKHDETKATTSTSSSSSSSSSSSTSTKPAIKLTPPLPPIFAPSSTSTTTKKLFANDFFLKIPHLKLYIHQFGKSKSFEEMSSDDTRFFFDLFLRDYNSVLSGDGDESDDDNGGDKVKGLSEVYYPTNDNVDHPLLAIYTKQIQDSVTVKKWGFTKTLVVNESERNLINDVKKNEGSGELGSKVVLCGTANTSSTTASKGRAQVQPRA